jgi:hypothetical protein
MATLPLDRMQRWMQSVVVHPGSIRDALASPLAAAEWPARRIRDVILPSPTLRPAERLEVYHGMYLLRMEEALAADYPTLKALLGDARFFDLVRDYVQVYPSRSHSLNRLGDHLADFLKNDRSRRNRDFLADLARLELATSEVFDAPETKPVSPERVNELKPDDWARAVLRPIAALRLVSLHYNVNDVLQAVKDEKRPPRAKKQASQLAVYRRDYGVYRLPLERAGFELLRDLVGGTALGEAIEAALKRGGTRLREPQLFRWFRDWMSSGLFAALKVLPPQPRVSERPLRRRSDRLLGGPGRTRTFD